jgi:hypothetical protein
MKDILYQNFSLRINAAGIAIKTKDDSVKSGIFSA